MEAAAAAPDRAPWAAKDRSRDQSDLMSVTLDQIARRLDRGAADSMGNSGLSRREMEELRVRAELSSVRSESASVVLPPSGREFDPVPDASDEIAYDALEKAYNLAFAVCAPDRLKRAEEDEQAMRRIEASGVAMVGAATSDLTHALARKKYAIEREESAWTNELSSLWKEEETAQHKRSVDKLRELRHQVSPTQNGEAATSSLLPVMSGPHSVLERAEIFATNRAKRQKTLLLLAEACRSRVLGRSRMRHQTDNGYTRPSSMSLTLQIPPQVTEEKQTRLQVSPDDDSTGPTPPECKALADFLAAQLSLFAGSITHGHPQTLDHRSASLASHQLWRDHQRTLTDFEFNSTSGHSAGTDQLSEDTLSERPNPFQRVGEIFDSAWKSSLKRVEYGDWQLGARADPSASPLRESNVSRELKGLYSRGLNAVMVHPSDGPKNEISSFLLQIQNMHTTGYIHVVVTEPTRIQDWNRAMSKLGILVVPRWGSHVDRERLKSMGVPSGRKKWTPRVFICGRDTVAEDLNGIAQFPLHLCIFDVDYCLRGVAPYAHPSFWARLLSLRCRQRILLVPPESSLDVRELALFAYPAAFCSRRKILAWNCAAPSRRLISSIMDAVNLCTICADNDRSILVDWSAKIQKHTLVNSQREGRKLDVITRDLAASSSADDGASYLMNLAQPKVDASTVSVKKPRVVRRDLPSAVSIEDVKEQSIEVTKPRKRRRRSSKARKRISRCGDCAGCLAEDCMKCGHCQDMKKYGGPGLRKQSCKRRKCLNPKTWGLKRKRAARYEDAAFDDVLPKNEGESSEDDYSDQDSLADPGDNSSSSSEESEVGSSVVRGDRSAPAYDSDSYESSHLGDDAIDSNNGDLFDHADETDIEDPSSEAGSYSRAGRSRVMRCGKCRGCTSGDCMKCLHCQDMKKYGGPGLRKQSCKNRKCIAPKVVLLNQVRERQDVGGDDGTDAENPQAADDLSVNERTLEVDVSDMLLSTDRLDSLHVVHECALVVRKFQFFSCDVCSRPFTSQTLLEQHFQACHEADANADPWERDAELILLHPAHQLACLIASRRSINPHWQVPPVRAYAKLEGMGFEYFLLKPFAVLGRLSRQWSKFYESRGMTNRKGLSGASLDCHFGDDGMIANQHALIRWDHTIGFFTIECVSFRSSVSVNGRDVHYSTQPLRLHSQDLIQIGATTAYFLLPKTESPPAAAAPKMSHANVRAWVDASVAKRRARAARDVAIDRQIRQVKVATPK